MICQAISVPRARRAYSLIELVVSIAISTMLLVGIGSALLIATKANDPSLAANQPLRDGNATAFKMLNELRVAQSFSERTPASVQFTIADRTGDATPETIRYAWSGTVGDPLTRQFNGGAAVTLLENVHLLTLAFQVRNVTSTQTETVDLFFAESMFSNFEGWSGISPTYKTFSVGPTSWCSEFFNAASLPNDAKNITITRCQLMLRQGAGGNVTVGIHRGKGGGNPEPSNNPVGTAVTIPVATLPATYQWIQVSFSDVTLANLNKEYCIVVKGDTSNAADVQYLYSTQAPKDDPVMLWNTGGNKWDPKKNSQADNDMWFRVWGTYEVTTTQTVNTTRYFVESTSANLQVGADSRANLTARINHLNMPEVSSP